MAEAASIYNIDSVNCDLQEKGWAVVPGVVPPEVCDQYVAEYREWLKGFGTGFPDNITSIIHKYKLGYKDTTWSARMRVKPLFSELWGTSKLLTSADGVAIGVPPEAGSGVHHFDKPGAHTLHFDQGPHRHGLHCYQGALYLETAEEDDWCFMVGEGSHKFHSEFFKNHSANRRSEFRRLDDDEVEWLREKGCVVKRVACPKGGVVLWDSRLLHAGAPALQGRKNPGRWRFIVFVSMTPAWWARDTDLAIKREAYETMRVTRHWPGEGASMFPKYRSFPAHDISELPEVAKTLEARQLAGVVPYDFDDGTSNGPKWRPKWR